MRIRLIYYDNEKELYNDVIDYLKQKYDILEEKTYPARKGRAKIYYAYLDWKGLGQKHLNEIKKNYPQQKQEQKQWHNKRRYYKSPTYVGEDEGYGEYYDEPYE